MKVSRPKVSSAKVSWTKNVAFATTKEKMLKKNWEGVLESVKGHLKRWSWLLPCMSYRGMTLVINSLASSYHRMAVKDPPSILLSQAQTVLVAFS